jgi:hypothetical protein
MSRCIKRVPLDFQWKHDKVWSGYLNPFSGKRIACPHCKGRGDSPEMKRLQDLWYGYEPFKPEDRGSVPFTPEHTVVRSLAERKCQQTPEFYGTGEDAIIREAQRLCDLYNAQWGHHLNDADVKALVDGKRLMEFTHTWSDEFGWQPLKDFVVPTARQVNEWSISGWGHDSINCAKVLQAEAKRLGLQQACLHCEGEGSRWPDEDTRLKSEAWERTEPPTGEGYQLWETVSEGSPVSPVFKEPRDLARWLVRDNHEEGTSYEKWLEFIENEGETCGSMLMTSDGTMLTGVQAF